MKLYLAGLLLLAACSPRVQTSFQVDTSTSPGAVATLALCSDEKPLKRHGEVLQLAVPITCEGRGEIRIRLKDGRGAVCPVGYVTPGAAQDFRFRLRDERCE